MHHVSTIYARFICRELDLNADAADELLSDSALSYQDVIQQGLMPYPDFFSFLRRVRQEYTDADLGLRVGSKLTPPSLGELGNAMMCAPTMADALKLSASFAHVHAAYFQLKLSPTNNGVKVEFIELADLGDTQEFQTEVMMQMVQNLIEAVTCKDFDQGAFYFPYHKPKHSKAYHDYFHSPCAFAAPHAALEMPNQLLQSSSPFYDPEAWQNYQIKLEQQLNKLSRNSEQDESAKPYTRHVYRFLSTGPLPFPSVEEAAAHLAMTSRSLSRHLKNEGSSFRDIRNQLLKEYAQYYLKESDLTVDTIACQLGYKDFSSFRRAFKQWFGYSPSEFRNSEP